MEAVTRESVIKFWVLWITFFCIIPDAAAIDLTNPDDYSHLIDFIKAEDRTAPLYVFGDYDTFDRSVHHSFLNHFNHNPAILHTVRSETNGNQLKWRIDGFKKRLLFVPEESEAYISLYESYCRYVIDFILQETKFENPYAAIKTLRHKAPAISSGDGITVFLVHNLVEEWFGTYAFFDEDTDREMSVTIKSSSVSGEIGSYSSMLEIFADGNVSFAPSRYTIWQNSSEKPYNALIVPLEETFHILLRSTTERAIQFDLSLAEIKDPEKIVSFWIAVEEGIVGGLVDVFFRRIATDLFPNFDLSEIESLNEEKSLVHRYRYIKDGIRAVGAVGVEQALDLYTANPQEFRDILIVSDEKNKTGPS